MKILLCPDKFKGSLTSAEVIAALARGISRARPTALLDRQIMADGGEGSLAVLQQTLPLQEHRLEVTGPLRRTVSARYLLGDGKAYIESAEACGLQHVPPLRRDPGFTTTIGVGQLIEDALARGATEINLFLGGSATNDAGVGMAAAVGWRFYSDRGNDFVPSGNSLAYVRGLDDEEVSPALKRARVIAIHDVDNPLLGEQGATFTYARQKGASEADLPALERHVEHLAGAFTTWREVAERPGTGAAGGLGFGAAVFLNAQLMPGADWLMEAVDLRRRIAEADLVITGEGKLDEQSLRGKVVGSISRIALECNTPVWVVAGENSLPDKRLPPGVERVLALLDAADLSRERAVLEAGALLEELIFRAMG